MCASLGVTETQGHNESEGRCTRLAHLPVARAGCTAEVRSPLDVRSRGGRPVVRIIDRPILLLERFE